MRMTALARRSITLALGAGLLVAAAVPGVRAATWPEHDAYAVTEDRTLVVEAPGLLMNDTPDGGAPCVVGIDAGGLMGWIGEHGDNGHTGWKTDGSFTFTPYDEWNGTTTFVYGMRTLVDGQCIGAAEGQATVTITVQPVNDPPTAVAGSCDGGITVDQDSGPYDDPSHCVENHAWGPIDENTQLVDEWVVTNDKPELFVDQPAIDVTQTTFGGLHFEPAPGAHGTATVTVRSRDTGGTANGGKDLSAPITFRIVVQALATPTQPLVEPTTSLEPIVSPGASAAPPTDRSSSPSAPATDSPVGEPTGRPTGTAPWTMLVLLSVVSAIAAGIVLSRYLRRRTGV